MMGIRQGNIDAPAKTPGVLGRSVGAIAATGERAGSFLSPKVLVPYLAAAILSLISFHTTYHGMRSFYGLNNADGTRVSRGADPISNIISQYLDLDVENIFALAFAAVVQGGILFASAYLSWLLLNSSAFGRRAGVDRDARWVRYFLVAVLMLLLPISIVFSYGARLEWQIGAEQKSVVQAGGAHSDASSLLDRLKGLMSDYEKALETKIGTSAEFRDWAANMRDLEDATSRADLPIRDYLQSVAKDDADRRDAERRRRATASQQTLDFEREADRVNDEIAALDQKIERMGQNTDTKPVRIVKLEERIAAAEEEMRKEQLGTGRCGSAGEGRCYAYFKGERDKLIREKETALQVHGSELQKLADNLTELKKQRIDKATELASIRDRARLTGVTLSPGASGSRTADLPRQITELQPSLATHGATLRKTLEELTLRFTPTVYEKAVETCRELQPLTMIDGLRARLARVDCDPGALAPAISDVTAHAAKMKQFETSCAAVPPFTGEGNASVYNSVLFEQVSSCIALADLGKHAEFGQRLTDITHGLAESMANRNAGVDYLTFTIGELRDGKRVAILALIFAVTIDALVLIFTLLGEIPRMRSRSGSLSLSAAERHELFRQLQEINDVLDTANPASHKVVRAAISCLGTTDDDGTTRMDLGLVANKSERHDVARRMAPFVASGLASRESEDVFRLTERALAMLAVELTRLIHRDPGRGNGSEAAANGAGTPNGYDKRSTPRAIEHGPDYLRHGVS